MKFKLALLPLVLLSVSALAQSVGGCISHFAENYDPNATFNDGSCNYDLQQLLNDGFELGDLLSSGVEVDELIGLFGAGGFIVDIDMPQDRVLLAWPHTSGSMWTSYDRLTAGLRSYMFFDKEFGTGIHDGEENWDKIRRNYSYRFGGYRYSQRYVIAELNSSWNTSGCSNWFVPTEEALLLYKNVCRTKYDGGSYSTTKDLDPDGGTEPMTLYACGNNYPFNSSNYSVWTSEPGNVSDDWNNDYASYKTITLNSVTSLNETVGYRSGNDYGYVFPMGISEIRTVGTINNCNDWSYNGSPNYASQLGLPCNYPLLNCETFDDPAWDTFVSGLYPAGRTLLDLGTSEVRSLQLKLPATLELLDNGGTANVYNVAYFEIDSIQGVPPGLTLNYQVGDTLTGGMVHCLEWSGAAVLGGRYDLRISGSYYVPVFGSLVSAATETYTHNFGVVEFIEYTAPDDASSVGCTYVGADNYDPQATIDDGSCTYQGICPGDLDADGIIGVMDILELLNLYDTPCN